MMDATDPLVQRVEALEQAVLEQRKLRGIAVSPFITVLALGRLCERHSVVAEVDWIGGQLQVRLVPKE